MIPGLDIYESEVSLDKLPVEYASYVEVITDLIENPSNVELLTSKSTLVGLPELIRVFFNFKVSSEVHKSIYQCGFVLRRPTPENRNEIERVGSLLMLTDEQGNLLPHFVRKIDDLSLIKTYLDQLVQIVVDRSSGRPTQQSA